MYSVVLNCDRADICVIIIPLSSVRPSVPKCWVEGGEAVGETVSLHCKSSEGSSPLNYAWKRERGGPIPPSATQSKSDLYWFHGELHQSTF